MMEKLTMYQPQDMVQRKQHIILGSFIEEKMKVSN